MTVIRVDPASFDWSDTGRDTGTDASTAAGRDTRPAAVVRRVVATAAEADGAEPLDEAAMLALGRPGLPGATLLLTGRTDDRSEGFALVRSADGDAPAEVDLVVAPEARGHGLGAALAEAALKAAGGPVSAWSHGDHPAAARLAERHGLRRARELWVMRRPLDDLPDAAAPDDVALRAFRPGEDDAALLALNAEAFAWHPEQGRLDQQGLDERKALAWFDPEGFLVAERKGRLVGFHWTKVHAEAQPFGEVYVIAVAGTERGTGLARALLAAGLRRLRDRGLDEVVLYVEAANVPAVRLYEREGFTHAPADTHVRYA